jgi:putative ABC transport system permease protein
MHNNIISAFRHFSKNRFFLTLNVISMVMGILVCSAILLNTWQQLRADHFEPNSKRIYRLNCGGYGVTPACFKDIIGSRVPEIEESARLNAGDLEIFLNNEALTIKRICYVDSNFIRIFGFQLVAGDPATALKNPFGLILTESLAKKIFGNSQVIGKTIIHNKKFVFTVSGVMKDLPSNSHLRINGLTSINNLPKVSENKEKLDDCGSWHQLTYLLLKDASQKSSCEKKINVLLEDHKMGTREGKIPLKLEALRSIYFDADGNKFDGSEHGNLLILLAFLTLGILTFIIACINCINFSLAQSVRRFKEIKILKIYGATKMQVTVKLIIEMQLIFLSSCMLAILLLELSLSYFSNQTGFAAGFPENRIYCYLICFVISILLGIIAGLFPSFYHNSRSFLLSDRSPEPHSFYIQKGILMILVQFALTAVFLISAFLVLHQINYMLKKDPGFKPANILQIDLDPMLAEKYDLLKKRLLQESGIIKVAYSDAWIGEGFGKAPMGEKGKEILCNVIDIDPDYCELMGIKIIDGRNFSWSTLTDTSTSIIMNETAARAFELKSGTGQLFGRHILAGIVRDFNFFSLKNEIEPLVMRCLKEKPRIVSILLLKDHQRESRKKVLDICYEISPDFHQRVEYVTDSLQKFYTTEILISKGITLYTLIAFTLSILGIIGICTISLQKRRKEMAIRRLHGASATKIIKMVMLDFLIWVFVAILIAIPIASYIGRLWIQSYAYHASFSPLAYIFSVLLILGGTGITIFIITFYNCRSNPAEILHEE